MLYLFVSTSGVSFLMLQVQMLMKKGLVNGKRFLKASSIVQMEKNRMKKGDKANWRLQVWQRADWVMLTKVVAPRLSKN